MDRTTHANYISDFISAKDTHWSSDDKCLDGVEIVSSKSPEINLNSAGISIPKVIQDCLPDA